MKRIATMCLMVGLACASRSGAQVQNIPEVDSFIYEFMYYSVYDDLNGFVTKGRVRPQYTMGVLDTILIDSPLVIQNDWIRKWRIRYEPLSLTPTKRYMEQFNGAYVRTETDSFVYERGRRKERYTQFYVDGIPWEYRRSLYESDSASRLLTRFDEIMIDGKWRTQVKRYYHCDELGQVIGVMDSVLKDGKFKADTREIWDYFDFTIDEVNRQGFKLGGFGGTWFPIERFSYFGARKREYKQFNNPQTILAFDTLTGTSQSKPFTFYNPTSEPVSVTGLRYGIGYPFIVTGLPNFPFTLFPGDSVAGLVTFSPSTRGESIDSVEILVDEIGSQTLFLTGRARKGSLALSQVAIDFGVVHTDSLASREIQLSNVGDAFVSVDSIVSLDPHFTSQAFIPVEITESGMVPVAVIFIPSDSIRYESQLIVHYHDQEGDYDTIITVVGNGFREPDSVLSVDRAIESMVTISPNPADRFIQIETSGLRITAAYFQTVTGERIDVIKDFTEDGKLMTEGLPSGMVSLVLETNVGVISKKLMIVR